jgi:hypothetical protein
MEKFDIILGEEIDKFLNEGLSDILYHFTYAGNLENILKTNKLNASSNLGTAADAAKDKGSFFYFSTQRSKGKVGYGGSHGSTACLVLDGRKLMSSYKGFPTDYWNWSMSRKDYDNPSSYKQALTSKEMEDRIVLDSPYIEPADRFIEEIHVLIPKGAHGNLKYSQYKEIENLANNLRIPIYFYDNEENYKMQVKNRALSLEQIKQLDSSVENDRDRYFRDEDEDGYVGRGHFYYVFKSIMPYLMINYKGEENDLWDLFMRFVKDKGFGDEEFNRVKNEILEKHNQLKKSVGDKYYDYYLDDFLRSISADFHNAKSSTDPYYREFLKILVSDIKRLGAKSLKDYLYKKMEISQSPPS